MRVLLVSKPLSAPWNDSGKNWARDVALFAPPEITHVVPVPRGAQPFWRDRTNIEVDRVMASSQYAPTTRERAQGAARILRNGVDLVHLCFAPNPTSNNVARWLTWLRRTPSVHTVLSVPKSFARIEQLLFADQVVCVSEHTANRLADEGVRGLSVIRASIPRRPVVADEEPARLTAVRRRHGLHREWPLILFAGDYDFGTAADVFVEAAQRIHRAFDVQFVLACRPKTDRARRREHELRQRLSSASRAGKAVFLREVDDIEALLAASTAVTMPLDTSYAKMDIPLVLLEALAQRTAVVISDLAPCRELLTEVPERSGGLVVPPRRPGALADAMATLLEGDTATRLGWTGRQHVLTYHNSAVECRAYGSTYRAALGR